MVISAKKIEDWKTFYAKKKKEKASNYIFVVDNFLIALLAFEICTFKDDYLRRRKGRDADNETLSSSASLSTVLDALI